MSHSSAQVLLIFVASVLLHIVLVLLTKAEVRQQRKPEGFFHAGGLKRMFGHHFCRWMLHQHVHVHQLFGCALKDSADKFHDYDGLAGKLLLAELAFVSSAHLFVWFSWAKQRLISLVSFVPGIPLGSLCVALRFLQGTIAQKLLVDLKALSLQTGDLGCTFVLGCLSFLLERHHGRCSLQAQDAPEKKSCRVALFSGTGFGTCWRSLVSLVGFSNTAIRGHGRSYGHCSNMISMMLNLRHVVLCGASFASAAGSGIRTVRLMTLIIAVALPAVLVSSLKHFAVVTGTGVLLSWTQAWCFCRLAQLGGCTISSCPEESISRSGWRSIIYRFHTFHTFLGFWSFLVSCGYA